MNSERKEIRKFLKKSLKSDFEKILYEAKMTADEEKIIRCICCKGMSAVMFVDATPAPQLPFPLQRQQQQNNLAE